MIRRKYLRRISTINETRIKYLLVVDKIYEVTSINWLHFSSEAKETDLKISDVLDSEVFNLEDFSDFKVRLVNGGVAEIIDFEEWRGKRRVKNSAFELVVSKAQS